MTHAAQRRPHKRGALHNRASGEGGSTNAKRQTRFPPLPLVTEPLSITLLATMGGYKGRVNVKNRKRRSAKAERIKAVAATKTAAKKSD